MNEDIKALSPEKRAVEYIKYINNTEDRFIVYRDSRPVWNLKQMFESSVERYASNPAFHQRFGKGEPYTTITYSQAKKDVDALGTALVDMGLQGKHIAVIGENCYQWAASYLAVTGGAGVVVPLDKELGKSELKQLCETAGVSAVLYTDKYARIFKEIKAEYPQLEVLINMSAYPPGEDYSHDEGLPLRELISKGEALLAAGDRRYLDAVIDPDAMGALLFTSGTTGIAKGVMLSQSNICYDLMGAPTLLKVREDDVFFSVLPLHHTYECTSGFLIPIYKGASIAYCEGLKYIQKNLKEIQPTMFLGVPLLFESLYRGIWKNIRKQGKENTVKRVLSICSKLGTAGLKLQKKLLKDIYDVFGSRMRVIIAGGAAVNPDVMDFFGSLGYLSVQGYGLTECSPMASLSPDDRRLIRASSVGHLLPGMFVKIDNPADDGIGEICLKGPIVMMGYYNMPEKTAEVLQDGWFHTGDLGYADKDNFIYITGRSKNVIIASNGKNVFPEELEYYLSKTPLIKESMVWAAKDEAGHDTVITATVIPDREMVAQICSGEYSAEAAEAVIRAAVDEINNTIPLFKQIRRVVIREEDFEKTTSNKIKRFVESNRE